MKICDLIERRFKIAVLKKRDKQFNKVKNKINKWFKYFTKEIDIKEKKTNRILGDEKLSKRDKEWNS